jgi:hypothetical protein
MSTEIKVRRGRGLGKKPRHALTSIRIPVYVLEYFKENFDNSTSKMREVLELYVATKGEMYGKSISEGLHHQTPERPSIGNHEGDGGKQGDSLQTEVVVKETNCEWCGLIIPEGAAWSPTQKQAY